MGQLRSGTTVGGKLVETQEGAQLKVDTTIAAKKTVKQLDVKNSGGTVKGSAVTTAFEDTLVLKEGAGVTMTLSGKEITIASSSAATTVTDTGGTAYNADAFIFRNGTAAQMTMAGANTLTLSRDPSAPLEAATKQYVDAVATGLDVKGSVKVATAAALGIASGTATTITLTAAATAVDGVTLANGDRILVKDETGANAKYNGLYAFSTTTTWTRATDADSAAEVTPGLYVFVETGTQKNRGYILQAPVSGSTYVLGTDDLNFTQFTGMGEITVGAGLIKNADTVSLKIAPNDASDIGGVKSASGVNGHIAVDASGYMTLGANAKLSSLNDVTVTAPSAGQFLGWGGSNWGPTSLPVANGTTTFGIVKQGATPNGLTVATDGTLSNALANSTTTIGTVKLGANANGLSITAGAVEMALANSTATVGTVKLGANANGLTITSGAVEMAKATTSTFGTVQVTTGNGLNLATGVLSMALASGTTAGSVAAAAAGVTNALSISSGTITALTATNTQLGVVSVAASDAITINGSGVLSHSTADGFKHVPSVNNTGTDNNKVLIAGATAGTFSWGLVNTANLTDKSVTLAKMADMATASFIGRATAASGVPEVLTATQARTILNVADGANNYVHPLGDGNLHVPANGTGNNGKFLQASGTAGTYTWAALPTLGGTGVNLGTANRGVITDASGNLTVSAATNIEVGYLSGVTSAIQTQLNAKTDIDRKTGVTAATAGYYRIMESPVANITNHGGRLALEWSQGTSYGRAVMYLSMQGGGTPDIDVIHFNTNDTATGIDKVRVVYHTTATGNFVYVEANNKTAVALTLSVELVNPTNLRTPTNVTTAGSIPSGYTYREVVVMPGNTTTSNLYVATGAAGTTMTNNLVYGEHNLTATAGSGLSVTKTTGTSLTIAHTTGAGNNHLPSGGAANQVPIWAAGSAATWGDNIAGNASTAIGRVWAPISSSTVDAVMVDATGKVVHGVAANGFGHLPAAGAAGNFIKWSAAGTGTWATPAFTDISGTATSAQVPTATTAAKGGTFVSTTTGAPLLLNTTTGEITHNSTDGYGHVPATSTTNNGKFLQAGAAAGTYQWAALPTLGGTGVNLGTANRSVLTDASGNLVVSTVTNTEIGYVGGVTSAIQTQINSLADVKVVKVATTGANITLSAPQTIDGVALVAGDRVLVKDQTTGSQNGIYVVNAAAWTRSTDADLGYEINAMRVVVQQGTVNQNTVWACTTTTTIVLDTTALTFAKTALYDLAGAASTISQANLTASRVLTSDGSGKVSASGITSTTLGYLDATSSIQTQLNNRLLNNADNSMQGKLGISGAAGTALSGGAPTITLALGDADTGFKWNADGNFDIVSNNVAIASVAPAAFNLNTVTNFKQGGTVYGSGATWSATLGLDGTKAGSMRFYGGTTAASGGMIQATANNFSIDATGSNALYLNYYSGTAINFGNGASGTAAFMGTDGVLWKGTGTGDAAKKRYLTEADMTSAGGAGGTYGSLYLAADVASEQVVSGSAYNVQSTNSTAKFVIEFNETEGSLDFSYSAT